MTIREIAKICKVSPATVSRVISGNAPVKDEVKQKIQEIILKSGYIPKHISRINRAPKSGIIGVLVPTLNHNYFQCVINEINKQLIDYGKTLVIIPINEINEKECINQMRSLSIEGIILLHEEISSNALKLLEFSNLPMVMCGALSISKKFSAVHIDDLAAAYDGTNYLIQLGHRNIAFISDFPHAISSGFQRIAGSKKAMEDKGIKFREELVICEGSDFEQGYNGAKKLVMSYPEITAVFAFCDEAAVGAINALEDMGYKVPRDISVLGFDDTLIAERYLPAITTVHQPIEDIVSKTLEVLLKNINQEDKMITSITLSHKIVERESCRKIYNNSVMI